ncbi:hypothetical protein CNBA3280 [Cryptococcus deneoformans B-3501A]|uniref:Expressed protein n=1 Tax=Cryptococcus deneoformans (strain JEC21 / ATCC MYA-565) TaxID=214684 RepID=Q5KPB5_CRYD1|nr:expressed protein [Cryptococcus neoformans var. neoformans JEC21]XP_778328.1 hypothetical protein CNBA3280 [Cryptococcus neoformans var. neoformans B-3501A]AAW41434.1 expressed protein [Cryptococcus neoformans var. neoformans JEC21]EAL23681.1 hypothetical protein CNBA3280 [Cryptococcus neoformans var. neoformans B-3501A]
MEDRLHSLSKGVFVIPFEPAALNEEDREDTHSSTRDTLDRLYETTLQIYEDAGAEYEQEKTNEQLDDIADWLERYKATAFLQLPQRTNRLPVAILQNASSSLPDRITSLDATSYTLLGRDAPDVAAALRSIAIGFTGDTLGSGRKSSQASIDEVENWWQANGKGLPLMLYIQDAQTIPASVLSEITYILALHAGLPIRLLLSVPSAAVFLSSWGHIEPSSVDVSILRSGRSRRGAGGIDAIIRSSSEAPFKISDDLAEELRSNETLLGGGIAAAMKTLKWLLLHHSLSSPLALLVEKTKNSEQERVMQSLLNAVKSSPVNPSIPRRDLFELNPHPDMFSVLNPAPRTSILHSLSDPQDILPFFAASAPEKPSPNHHKSAKRKAVSASMDNEKRRKTGELEKLKINEEDQVLELKRLQTLFELWKSAGKTVNLWDWLDSFQGEDERGSEENKEANSAQVGSEQTDKDENIDKESRNEAPKRAAQEENRLHATFIRFVEEARMLGLIRARGKGRKADEVIKSVGLV